MCYLVFHKRVISVVDSSRYFALRISDSNTGREAFIGVGFRERTDATNFKMSIQDFENSLKREERAVALQKQFDKSLEDQSNGECHNLPKLFVHSKSNLSLKEGEKIHINLKGKPGNSYKLFKHSCQVSGISGIALKKPPPPPDDLDTTADNDAVDWGDFEG